jgi:nanoRNase/pAp phosphatase (c-di-AMP/oligoRNAs hydrolase)
VDQPTPALALPADYTAQKKAAVERRLQQLAEVLADRNRILVLLHSDPDPDAIASGLAMERILRHLLPEKAVTLSYGGMIGRAENRTMASLFTPHIVHIPAAEAAARLAQYDAIALVDTQPGAGNHILYGTQYPLEDVVMAIDHHPPKRAQTRAVIQDVRPEIGACSTMLCEYLAAMELTPDPVLATALFYGIKSDTLGLSRHTTALDAWAYMVLRNLVDTPLLNRIEQVRLPVEYFRSLNEALDNTALYRCAANRAEVSRNQVTPDTGEQQARPVAANGNGTEAEAGEENGTGPCTGDVAVSLLYEMKRPDMAAEVADLMLRLEDVSWAICLGIYQERLVISLRTDVPEAQAGRLVRSIVGRNGSAGGHDTMAGGRIHLPDQTPAERVAALHGLVPRFLHVLGVGDASGEPLL